MLSQIDKRSESNSVLYWEFVEMVKSKFRKMKSLRERVEMRSKDEKTIRRRIFPGETEYNVLGQGIRRSTLNQIETQVQFSNSTHYVLKHFFSNL